MHKNKGSVLVTTLIIFSIIITITMSCIGLNYTNASIFNLEYKEAIMKQFGYGAIDIVHSNILKEVETAIETTSNKDEFDKYFLNESFINSIKDISKSGLKGVSVSKPSAKEIKIDKTNGLLEFDINTLVKNDTYKKKFKASVKIKNPFFYNNEEKDEDLEVSENIEDEIYEFGKIKNLDNINDLVIIYDYKEI